MNAIKLFLAPYLGWIKLAAGALAIAAALYAWHLFTEHYVDIGREEVQALWNQERAESLLLTDARKDTVFSLNGLSVGASFVADANLQKAEDNEKTQLSIDNAALRKRLLATHAKNKPSGGIRLPHLGPNPFPLDQDIRIELTPESAENLNGIGSEGNSLADLLREAQALLAKDREICNGQ